MKLPQHMIEFDGLQIPFSLSFGTRKSLKIDVHPDQTVTVTAPSEASVEEVVVRVRRRAPWIVKQIRYFDRFVPLQPPRRYVGGETHLYLGRQYRLKIIECEIREAKLMGGYLHVHAPNPNDHGGVRKLVERWYRDHAVRILNHRLKICYESMKKFDLPALVPVFRKMDKRWGSCSTSGKIMLNTELARAPIDAIDYVVTHELCHLKYPHHGKEFYQLLERVMPDWERRKERLEMSGCQVSKSDRVDKVISEQS